MSKQDLLSIVPLFILTSASILILFSIAVKRNHKVIYVITAMSLLADFIYLFSADAPVQIRTPNKTGNNFLNRAANCPIKLQPYKSATQRMFNSSNGDGPIKCFIQKNDSGFATRK